jgi:hypothetical protein
MAVAVAPLTTAVINAVPAHRTGVASGINNAVASVATLLAVAIFAAVALSGFNRALDHHLQQPALSAGVRQAIEHAHGTFVIESAKPSERTEERMAAEAMIREALAGGIRLAMLLAAVLALAGAACAAFTIPASAERPAQAKT